MVRTALLVVMMSLVMVSAVDVTPAQAFSFREFWASLTAPFRQRQPDFHPYLEHGRHTHNRQWDHDGWEPEDWVSQRKDGLTLVDDFYRADIIRNQFVREGEQILVVGPAFYMLGGQDKRRVMATVDHVYEVTDKPGGSFSLQDYKTRKIIGLYTAHGLQLQ